MPAYDGWGPVGRVGAMDCRGWIDRFAAELGVAAPDDAEIDALLGLAGIAAHSAERTAAPLSCWLAARAGVTPEEALQRAKALADQVAAQQPAD